MDKAPAYGAGDSRFESGQSQNFSVIASSYKLELDLSSVYSVLYNILQSGSGDSNLSNSIPALLDFSNSLYLELSSSGVAPLKLPMKLRTKDTDLPERQMAQLLLEYDIISALNLTCQYLKVIITFIRG